MLAWSHPFPAYLPNVWCDGMRVTSGLLRATVFIGVEHNGVFTPSGSALVGGVLFGDLRFPCLVTAHHVVDQIPGEVIYVRLNRRNGDCETVRVSKAEMFLHTEQSNDIAVFPFSFSHEIYDHLVWALDRENRTRILTQHWQHDTGDDVCVVGLYTSHYGRLRNAPVVRSGNIAAMPGEPVMCHKGYAAAYLIELRSIAGLSGSPVYTPLPRIIVRPDRARGIEGHVIETPMESPIWTILGILIGYHVVESKEDQIAVPRFGAQPAAAFNPDAAPDERNTGFSVVIPIERVFDILEREDVMAKMKEAHERHFKEGGFRQASAPLPPAAPVAAADSEANPEHRADFRTLASAAARKKKPAD